jgi:hypothetical protein
MWDSCTPEDDPFTQEEIEEALIEYVRASGITNLVIPTHGGVRIQVEISLPLLGFTGVSGTIGGNVVYNRVVDQIAIFPDWAIEPGAGLGGGVSLTTGYLVGWASSDLNDVTSGFSGILSATAAAEIAGSVGITFPLESTGTNEISGLHVDPHFGQVPVTIYIGGGIGGAYAGLGGGLSGALSDYIYYWSP